MRLIRATTEDYESIIAFYDDVTDRTPDMERFARWQKGKHPTEEGIRALLVLMPLPLTHQPTRYTRH